MAPQDLPRQVRQEHLGNAWWRLPFTFPSGLLMLTLVGIRLFVRSFRLPNPALSVTG